MASLFRSISIKIFGVSVGLLAMMVITAVWSARSTEQVHRQLHTLEQSLFPLAATLGRLGMIVQSQKIIADYMLDTPDEAAVAACTGKARAQATAASRLVADARRFHEIGTRIAVTEHNRLALARLGPMLEELSYQETRLSQATFAACAIDADATDMNTARVQAEDVYRHSAAIIAEINALVQTGARTVDEDQQIALQANILMIASASLVGIMLAWLISRGLTRPIVRLQAGARAVGAGRLEEAHVPVTTRDEIGDVTQAFNAMIVDLREKERIKETFGQYLDPRVVADLIDGAQHSSAGEKQIATLFFSDMVGFTAIGERLAPSTLVELVNAYFSEMSQPIREHSGVIDKYIGDAIMAFWVPPFVDATRQAELACRAALEQFRRLEAFRSRVPDLIGLRRDVPLIDFRIGLSTGEVVVGSVGSQMARSFTVMGDSVNQASRLEAVNKVYGTRILLDEETFSLAGSAIEARLIDEVTLAGRSAPLKIYELAAMAGELPPAKREMFEHYEFALSRYRTGDWAQAESEFSRTLALEPDDLPAQTMLERTRRFQTEPPREWNGVWHLTAK